jgi:ABC-type phosphate transport system auxiliary subunit
VLIGAGVLGTALYWTQGGSAWIWSDAAASYVI